MQNQGSGPLSPQQQGAAPQGWGRAWQTSRTPRAGQGGLQLTKGPFYLCYHDPATAQSNKSKDGAEQIPWGQAGASDARLV